MCVSVFPLVIISALFNICNVLVYPSLAHHVHFQYPIRTNRPLFEAVLSPLKHMAPSEKYMRVDVKTPHGYTIGKIVWEVSGIRYGICVLLHSVGTCNVKVSNKGGSSVYCLHDHVFVFDLICICSTKVYLNKFSLHKFLIFLQAIIYPNTNIPVVEMPYFQIWS